VANIIELEVTAGVAEGQYAVRVVRSVAGGESTATMNLDAKAYLGARDDLENVVLASAAASRRTLSAGEQRLRDVGQQLFEALFCGPVQATYRASARAADARGERLRVVLRLDAPGLAGIPWEAMYDAEKDEYICLNDPLIRHIASSSAEPLEITSSLEVLVLVASPAGLTALDVEAERKKLADALAEPIADGRIHVTWLMQASWEQVQDEMLSGTWHVLHFIGHGDYDPRSDQGVIVLVGDDGGPNLVEADRLADLLNQADPTPRLVVLNSCLSGRTGASDLFSSTAATLVRRGISAVAAMQFSVSDAGAIKFARGFYSAIANGRGIGDAIGAGRVGLRGTRGSLEWVTPVLYVRGESAELFRIAPTARQATPPAPAQLTGPARKGLSKGALAAIGGIGAAVVTALVISPIIFRPSPEGPPPPPPPTTTSPTTTGVTTTPITDADATIQALGDVGVDYTVPRPSLVSWLNNPEFTPYPALSAALLEVLGHRGLRLPVSIDVIESNYASLSGAPTPKRLEEIDPDVLKAAVLEGFNLRHGEQNTDFQWLLNPRRRPQPDR
jgi:CHAT domain